MRRLDHYWKSNRSWWHWDKNCFPVINEDAPEKAKESYRNYIKQLKEHSESL